MKCYNCGSNFMSRWTCRSITKYACLDCGYYDKEEEKKK